MPKHHLSCGITLDKGRPYKCSPIIRPLVLGALNLAQDEVDRQDFRASWCYPCRCGGRLPPQGVFAKVVEVEAVRLERYGRTVAFVRVGDTVVNEELIRRGLARVFTQYCDRPICERWECLETEARDARRGLWSMPNAIPPWEFRRRRG
jgi:Staphylococcal nuclease homologue